MSLDVSKILSELGDDLIAQTGEPVGLDRDQSIKVAHALGANFTKGQDEAVKAAAADTGLTEDVVSAMLGKLVEVGKEKLLNEGAVGQAIDQMKDNAMAAFAPMGDSAVKQAGGFFGKLFGKK